MAFSRKMLKALGIEDDKIETIIEEHTNVTEALKQERDGYKADAEKLDGVQKELDELKAKGDDGYKEKYEALTAEIAKKQARDERETAYRAALTEIGIKEKYIDTIVRADGDVIDGLTVVDGKIKDADKVFNAAKERWSDFAATKEVRHDMPNNPPYNNGGSAKTKEQIMAIKDPATRQAEIAKNPEVFGLKFD